MDQEWQIEEQDEASGRAICAREIQYHRQGITGTYDFSISREFQVRNQSGDVLLQVSGSAKGEYWCGVFLFFLEGSNGKRVRLVESDRPENTFLDVPDTPLAKESVWT